MSRTTILAIVFVAVLAAALWFGLGTANAAEAAGVPPFDPGLPPKPDPLFKPLAEPRQATVETSSGPVTLVQRWDLSGANELTKPVAPAVPLVRTSTLKLGGVTRL
jgi:hypothetical protein